MPNLSGLTRFRGDFRMYARFARGLRRYLREPKTLDDARALLRKQLAERESNFMRVLERGVFGHAGSPYLPLLREARCELGDIRAMVREKGLEATLMALREAGVYVTFEEFKGREPMVRNGNVYEVADRDFDNPWLEVHYYAESGGSTGAGSRVHHDLDHFAAAAGAEILSYDAHDALGLPKALWRGVLPDGSGVNNLLRFAHYGYYFDRWFTPVGLSELRSPRLLKFRAATEAIVLISKAFRVPIPWPERVGLDQAMIVAQWAADTLRAHGRCLVVATVSRALRVSLAAREAGIDLTGALFRVAGEPLSPAKAKGIEASGARVFTTYGFSEIGRIGMGCSRPVEHNDMHLVTALCAMIQYPRTVPGTEAAVHAFNFTSLLPSGPKILLNAESDDYGIVEQRSCGCPLEELGLSTHLRRVRSFRKLTGEGVTLVGSEIVHIMEEVLPARFGGTPLDYQLVEEEDEDGFTRLDLRIAPGVEIDDEQRVVDVMMSALADGSVMADAARAIWQQAHTLRVRREEPIWTARGKFMSLYTIKPTPDERRDGRQVK